MSVDVVAEFQFVCFACKGSLDEGFMQIVVSDYNEVTAGFVCSLPCLIDYAAMASRMGLDT